MLAPLETTEHVIRQFNEITRNILEEIWERTISDVAEYMQANI